MDDSAIRYKLAAHFQKNDYKIHTDYQGQIESATEFMELINHNQIKDDKIQTFNTFAP